MKGVCPGEGVSALESQGAKMGRDLCRQPTIDKIIFVTLRLFPQSNQFTFAALWRLHVSEGLSSVPLQQSKEHLEQCGGVHGPEHSEMRTDSGGGDRGHMYLSNFWRVMAWHAVALLSGQRRQCRIPYCDLCCRSLPLEQRAHAP